MVLASCETSLVSDRPLENRGIELLEGTLLSKEISP